MFTGLHDLDWSSMQHAYGSAEEVPSLLLALRSTDADERSRALDRFYSAVHHQGDVYPCTTASLPFLFEMADEDGTPDRAAIVGLLVSIGSEAIARSAEEGAEYVGPADYVGAAAIVREHAGEFVKFAADADPRVRQAAIPGLALFLDDPDRAAAVLRDRLPAAGGIVERLLVVEAMATLALRLPASSEEAMVWFAGLIADPSTAPETKLAALVQRARSAPEQIGDDLVPAAIGLLRETADAATPTRAGLDEREPSAPAGRAPPQILAAFEDLERQGRVYAPTTDLLRTFHRVLAARIPQRVALLKEQLRSPDPGARLDAIRMSGELMQAWRGDHARLAEFVAEHLDEAGHEVAAEAAAVLNACHRIAEPARESLARLVTAQGPDTWASPRPHLRRAHQEAVCALARLGDMRAVPSLLAALDGEVDDWRAVQVAGCLPDAADQLVPRLCEHSRRLDITGHWSDMSACSVLSALAALGDQAVLPSITDLLTAAARLGRRQITCSALNALRVLGPAAAPTLGQIRSLTAASDDAVQSAAVAALWGVGGDREEVMSLLLGPLEDPDTFWASEAADILGEIGPPAAATLPRLRRLLDDDYEWVRVHCAAALWEIGGEKETSTVLDVLLQAWTQNSATGNHVVACLDRMGLAAEPALPQLRSQLALPRRGGRFGSIDNDEELQRVGRGIIERLA